MSVETRFSVTTRPIAHCNTEQEIKVHDSKWIFPSEDHNPQGGSTQEYSFRILHPHYLRSVEINCGLAGRNKEENLAARNAGFTTSQRIVFNGVLNGVLYRQLLIRKSPNKGVDHVIDLAEISIPGGVIRVDRCRLALEHELTLGHYGLPHIRGQRAVLRLFEIGNAKCLTASIPGRQVAFIAYYGWDFVSAQAHRGFNAEAEESTVLGAYRKRTAKTPPMEPMISAMLHKTDNHAWTQEELSPLRNMQLVNVTPSGSVIGAELTLSEGIKYVVNFKDNSDCNSS